MVGPKGGVGLFDLATGKFDDRFASVETPSAFGAFCKGLDSADPNYWQRVYEHLGIKHTPHSRQRVRVRYDRLFRAALLR
jgi:hypothetical protein